MIDTVAAGNASKLAPKVAALHAYQLSLPAPESPLKHQAFTKAPQRGDDLFSGKARCNNCHVEPLWTEPGWNMHTAAEVCIDDFQANRAPDRRYRTAPLGGLFTHQKGGFYHDGRFATLNDVVDHYNSCMNLGLTADEKADLVAYLLTL
jgi:cytochrome c peroxidase